VRDKVELVLMLPSGEVAIPMARTASGYFEHREERAQEGLRYVYQLDTSERFPDPASRWQPAGVHGPSALYCPQDYSWSDNSWHGIPREELVFYEIHVGAFTAPGTLEAILPRLSTLRQFGVTALEIMPLAQFPGDRNWGYDGVYPYAVQASYGGPRALQHLVNAAHAEGLAVVLDVVYNHLGPEGNYLTRYGPYFTDRYRTPWGQAINFDGPDSDAVRQFYIDNACMWVRDFHLDGLRLDAVHAIFDRSPRHILADIRSAVELEAAHQRRSVHVIAESDENDSRLLKPPAQGGQGLDAVWNDDFHHGIHALLTRERDGYYQDFGSVGHLVRAYNHTFVYDGCYSKFRRRRHGSPVGDLDPSQFVVSVQNHDQVGNRAVGDRFGSLLAPEAQRLACALLLLSPYTPLLFMGEEYGETTPFPFFCSYSDDAVIASVRSGRRQEFAELAFRWPMDVPDPQALDTFHSAKLSWQWPEGTTRSGLRRLYAELLAARRHWPALRDRKHTTASLLQGHGPNSGGPAESLLILRRGHECDLLAIACLSEQSQTLPPIDLNRRTLILSTEENRFGGSRVSLLAGTSILLPFELQVYGHSETPA
jgi:maltooligosyltrehalose trehalohydrolase